MMDPRTNENYCLWTVAPGKLAGAAQAMVGSARDVGMFKDIHVWTDGGVDSATAHPLGRFDPSGGLFRLTYLRDFVNALDRYEYYVWLDPRTRFLGHPGSLLRALNGAPVHVSLTFDLAVPSAQGENWNGLPCQELARLMQSAGLTNSAVYAGSSGFYIVHRHAAKTFVDLAYEFWKLSDRKGLRLPCEPLLAFAMQMLCGDPRKHLASGLADLWQLHPAEGLESGAPAKDRSGSWNSPAMILDFAQPSAQVQLQMAGSSPEVPALSMSK